MATTSKKLIITTATALLGVLVFSQAAANAGAPRSADGTATIAVESEFKCKQVKKYEQLPDLPQYSGQAEFVSGIISPEARGGSAITYEILARENQQMIIYWYRETLKMYKWNTCSDQGATSVSASKGGNYVQVTVSNSGRTNYPTSIMISYRSTR